MSQLLLSALAVVCPTCDGHNPPRAEVCATCATPLAEAPGTGRASGEGKSSGASARGTDSPPGLRPAARTPPPVPTASPPVAPRPTPVSTGTRAYGPVPPPPPVSVPVRTGSAPPVPKPAVAAPRPVPTASRFGLMVVAGSSRGQRFKLPTTGCTVGRTRGAILFGDDAFVSAQHASLVVRDNALFVRDEGSASGVYVTIPGSELLLPMSFFIVGQRLFRFLGKLEAPPPLAGRPTVYGAPVPPGQGVYGVEEVLVGGRSGRTVVTSAPLLTIGQANCDFSYTQEEGMAGRHCELSFTPGGAQLRDLSGGLGTYVRLASGVERQVRAGDRVRLGQHIVQVEVVA